MNIRIRVLHAIDHLEIAQDFQAKYINVLNEFGLSYETKDKWWENSGTYMFIAEDSDTGEIGAGMRLDVIDSAHNIPMEEAIERFNPEFANIIHKYDDTLAEVCAWWTTKKFSERKLPSHLLRTAIAIASKLRLHTLVGFPHEYTINITNKLGFTKVDYIDGLGDHGTFNYPSSPHKKDKYYKSTIVELLDTTNLPTVPEKEKEFILWLRKNPELSYNYEYKGKVTKLSYDLKIV